MWYDTKSAAATAVLLGWVLVVQARVAFEFPHAPKAPIDSCPTSWTEAGPGSFRWTLFRSVESLKTCNQTVLFSMPIHQPMNDKSLVFINAATALSTEGGDAKLDFGGACQAGCETRKATNDITLVAAQEISPGIEARDNVTAPDAIAVKDNSTTISQADSIAEAVTQLSKHLAIDPDCRSTTMFARSGEAFVGLYVGSSIRKSSAVPHVEKFVEYIKSSAKSLPTTVAAQLCGTTEKKLSSRHGFGIIADLSGDLALVHEAVATWANATCIDGLKEVDVWEGQEFSILPITAQTMGPAGWDINGTDPISAAGSHNATSETPETDLEKNNPKDPKSVETTKGPLPEAGGKAADTPTTSEGIKTPDEAATSGVDGAPAESDKTAAAPAGNGSDEQEKAADQPEHDTTPTDSPARLFKRADCRVYSVIGGDDCWKIATAHCGLSNLDELYKYNPDMKSVCDKGISAGDRFCCNAGTLPSSTPPKNADGTCKHIVLESGDDCTTIPGECGVTAKQFASFNGGSGDLNKFCSSLEPSGVYCCGPGEKPDLRPKKNPDGTCVSMVFDGRLCGELQKAFFLKEGDLDKFNKGKTWGWSGCSRLMKEQVFCLSDGEPPMPVQKKDITCGPQKQGTKRPSDMSKVGLLNPCPINACCSVWGSCGPTEEFCTDTTVDKTPGTAKAGTDGCISNCGMDIVNNGKPPASFSKVAYFEAWNQDRDCLHMNVDSIPSDKFTHVHFSFGTITPDFQINVDSIKDQFAKLKAWNTPIKKILSFGGWAFSTEPATINVFRAGVLPENREKLASNVAKFITDNGLDGVDFDWEYPGADDIPDTTPGTAEDAPSYLEFLKLVKKKLGNKSVSIAAPASYWYLRNFPIKEISEVVDYIIYMTYDFHGSWDYSMRFAMPGCENGDCLRSHINITETMNSLSMITKAGVESRKVIVGVSSYGRSFKMAKEGCAGPDCKYVGEKYVSYAAEGLCTQTAGYLADAEIYNIMMSSDSIVGRASEFELLHDDKSDSDILVYDKTEWVAFMSAETKAGRTDKYKGLNFGGTSDWAIDLSMEYGNERDASYDWGDLVPFMQCDYEKTYDNLDAIDKDADKMDANCAAIHTLRVLNKMFEEATGKFGAAKDGYDGKFDTYADYIKKTLGGNLMKWAKTDGAGQFRCYYGKGFVKVDRKTAKEVACDKVTKERGYMESATYWFEVKDQKEFEKKLLEDLGIPVDWVMWGKVEDVTRCQQTDHGTGLCSDTHEVYEGLPVPKPDFKVDDPKVLIETAEKNFSSITAQFFGKELEIALDQWDPEEATAEDAVQVLSVPVYLILDAVASMEEVKKIGGKIQEEEKKNLILTIISSILMIVPFIGQAIGSLGRAGAMIARLVSALELGAEVGLGTYEIINDPDSAPMAIVGMVMAGAGAGLGSSKRFGELGSLRKGMSDGTKAKMGASWKEHDPKVQSIMGKSCGRK